MKNILKFLREKTVKITVQDNVITVEREDGQNAVFEANKDNYLSALETSEETFTDFLLESDDIKVYVNGEIIPKKERRIFAGYYKRYDGMPFYVADVAPDLETGKDMAICRNDHKRQG